MRMRNDADADGKECGIPYPPTGLPSGSFHLVAYRRVIIEVEGE